MLFQMKIQSLMPKGKKIKLRGFENETHIEVNELIKDDKILVELLNNHYINIVEKTSGLETNCTGNPENPNLDKSTVLDFINKSKDHASTIRIKELCVYKTSFEFPEATTEDISKFRKLNPNKAT